MSNLSKFDLADETISNVTFFWTKIQKPSLKFQSQVEKEFVVDVLVDKATAKAWNKEFIKQKGKAGIDEQYDLTKAKHFTEDELNYYLENTNV